MRLGTRECSLICCHSFLRGLKFDFESEGHQLYNVIMEVHWHCGSYLKIPKDREVHGSLFLSSRHRLSGYTSIGHAHQHLPWGQMTGKMWTVTLSIFNKSHVLLWGEPHSYPYEKDQNWITFTYWLRMDLLFKKDFFISVSMCVCACMIMWVYMCLFVFVCVCLSVCLGLYVSVSIWRRPRRPENCVRFPGTGAPGGCEPPPDRTPVFLKSRRCSNSWAVPPDQRLAF